MLKLRRWFVVTLGVAAVGVTALPMLPVWQETAQPSPTAALTTGAASAADEISPTRIIVDLRDDVTAADIGDLEARLGIDLQDNSIVANSNKLEFVDVPATEQTRVLQALSSDERVEAAEPEVTYSLPQPVPASLDLQTAQKAEQRPKRGGFVPNDPRYDEQWNFRMVGAEASWKRSRGKDVVVAVIDTGVASRKTKNGIRARDFNKTSFVQGYNFIDDSRDAFDDIGHGTHVAGTIAESTNNNEGVAGLAFEASIMPLKVFSLKGGGGGTSGDIADAIRYAADNGAKVINMSLGGPHPSLAIHLAVKHAKKKGLVIVCSAGNGFGEPVGYPAAFPECIAVSAVGPSGKLAVYSSYGKQVTLAAPGGDMRNGVSEGVLQNSVVAEELGGHGDDYYHFQGTSMAAPHVSAAAALLLAQEGVTDAAQVRDLLTRSAVPQEPRLEYGAGLLSADGATGLVVRRHWFDFFKDVVVFILTLLLFRFSSVQPMGPGGVAVGVTHLRFRLAIALALCIGAFVPMLIARWAGTDSIWNLIGFSAFLPFVLFWEWEKGIGSKIVAAFSWGVALCLGWALVTATTPFTFATFGDRALLWTVANIGAALVLANIAWQRGKSA